MNQPKKPLVYAYGFDSLGFVLPGESEIESAALRFIGFQSEVSLEDADGLIIPSGLFERYRDVHSIHGNRTVIDSDKSSLARREKQMAHA